MNKARAPVPNTFQPQSQPTAAIAPAEQQPATFWLLAASVVFYLAVILFGTIRGYLHLHVVLLLLQYFLILPTALVYLRSRQGRESFPGVAGMPAINLRIMVTCFALLALPLSWFTVRGLMNPDESGYSFQARIYRSGRIMADPLIGATANVRETPAELFYANHVLLPKGWFPKFPPGWPLVLSLGYLVSARWLLTPIFGAIQLVVIAACGSRCFSKETGWIAALFAALSPFYLVNSIGMMSHALCALLAAAACLALFIGLATSNLRYYAGMFACLSAMLQVRPYTGFVMTLVLTGAALLVNRKDGHILARILGIGSFFGVLALACVLVYNHTYSGNWFVSPYALAAGSSTPPELSLNPGRVWQGIRQAIPQTPEESLIGAFPFAYLLAGYAVLRETTRRREVWILAAVYASLVIAYLAHPDGSGVFFGERFHFEGFFALLILAARGFMLLVEGWRVPHRVIVRIMVLLLAMQGALQAAVVTTVARRGQPYRKVREALADSSLSGLVLLRDSPGFVAKHFNLNDADWRHSPRIYLIDADPDRRSEWACRYGVSTWAVVSYDAYSHHAVLVRGEADCSSRPK